MRVTAVLTGDMVDSSSLSAGTLSAVLNDIAQAANHMALWPRNMPVSFGRRGGDGWQIGLPITRYSFRAALFIQAALRRHHPDTSTRIAIAHGTGTVPDVDDGPADSNFGHGQVFTDSGRQLVDMPRSAQMVFAAGGALDATLRLADTICQGWTQAQSRALYEMLPPGAGPRAAIADRLGISRPAVNQALWAAHYPALAAALTLIETDADD